MSGCDASLTNTSFQCPNHKHGNTTNQIPLSLRSLPPEVELCASSIPGTGFGICAKRAFPVGAWIGPYEGTFVKPEELSSVKDTSYMWEVSVIHRQLYITLLHCTQAALFLPHIKTRRKNMQLAPNVRNMHKLNNTRFLTILWRDTLSRTYYTLLKPITEHKKRKTKNTQ